MCVFLHSYISVTAAQYCFVHKSLEKRFRAWQDVWAGFATLRKSILLSPFCTQHGIFVVQEEPRGWGVCLSVCPGLANSPPMASKKDIANPRGYAPGHANASKSAVTYDFASMNADKKSV